LQEESDDEDDDEDDDEVNYIVFNENILGFLIWSLNFMQESEEDEAPAKGKPAPAKKGGKADPPAKKKPAKVLFLDFSVDSKHLA
jgi:hypothetical protein